MIVDSFDYTTNNWINGVVGYSGPAYYIEVHKTHKNDLIYIHGTYGDCPNKTRISKNKVAELVNSGTLGNGMLIYLQAIKNAES